MPPQPHFPPLASTPAAPQVASTSACVWPITTLDALQLMQLTHQYKPYDFDQASRRERAWNAIAEALHIDSRCLELNGMQIEGFCRELKNGRSNDQNTNVSFRPRKPTDTRMTEQQKEELSSQLGSFCEEWETAEARQRAAALKRKDSSVQSAPRKKVQTNGQSTNATQTPSNTTKWKPKTPMAKVALSTKRKTEVEEATGKIKLEWLFDTAWQHKNPTSGPAVIPTYLSKLHPPHKPIRDHVITVKQLGGWKVFSNPALMKFKLQQILEGNVFSTSGLTHWERALKEMQTWDSSIMLETLKKYDTQDITEAEVEVIRKEPSWNESGVIDLMDSDDDDELKPLPHNEIQRTQVAVKPKADAREIQDSCHDEDLYTNPSVQTMKQKNDVLPGLIDAASPPDIHQETNSPGVAPELSQSRQPPPIPGTKFPLLSIFRSGIEYSASRTADVLTITVSDNKTLKTAHGNSLIAGCSPALTSVDRLAYFTSGCMVDIVTKRQSKDEPPSHIVLKFHTTVDVQSFLRMFPDWIQQEAKSKSYFEQRRVEASNVGEIATYPPMVPSSPVRDTSKNTALQNAPPVMTPQMTAVTVTPAPDTPEFSQKVSTLRNYLSLPPQDDAMLRMIIVQHPEANTPEAFKAMIAQYKAQTNETLQAPVLTMNLPISLESSEVSQDSRTPEVPAPIELLQPPSSSLIFNAKVSPEKLRSVLEAAKRPTPLDEDVSMSSPPPEMEETMPRPRDQRYQEQFRTLLSIIFNLEEDVKQAKLERAAHAEERRLVALDREENKKLREEVKEMKGLLKDVVGYLCQINEGLKEEDGWKK